LNYQVVAYLHDQQAVTANLEYNDEELSKPLKGVLKEADALDKKLKYCL
jgi:hypothetical protein